MSDLNTRMASGAVWMIGARIADRTLGLVSTMILARLLVPADFGVVAMATAVMAFLDLFRAFGFDLALIQNQDAQRRHYDTVWTINILFAVAMALILVVVAAPAAAFFDVPSVRLVIYCLAVATFMSGFANVGIVNFRKDLEFGKEFKYTFFRKLAGFAVTVPLAFVLRNYWALVAGIFSLRVGGIALSYALHEYRPRLSLAARREIFGFSRWLMAHNFANFFIQRSGDFILGKLAGSRALGLFNVSFEVANLPSSELVAPINRAVFPGYAKRASNLPDLKRGLLDATSVIVLLLLPAGLGLAATSGLVVPVFLGAKWLAAAPLVGVLAVRGVAAAVQTNTGYAYVALGKPQLATLMMSLQLAVLLPLLAVGAARAGAVGAVWAYLAASVVTLPVNYFIARREFALRISELAQRTWRPLVASALMLAAVWGLGKVLPPPETAYGQLGRLLLVALIGCAVYCSSIVVLWTLSEKPAGVERFLITYLRSKLRAIAAQVRGGK
jgi:O-antigen/teichoic acid export membrane protein